MAQTQKMKPETTQERSFNGAAIRAVEGEERRFELSFSSEEPYQRWFGPEILSHAEGAADLSRLSEIGVLLFNHDVDQVLGRVERVWIESGRGKAVVVFDEGCPSAIRWTAGRKSPLGSRRPTVSLVPAKLPGNGCRWKFLSSRCRQTPPSASGEAKKTPCLAVLAPMRRRSKRIKTCCCCRQEKLAVNTAGQPRHLRQFFSKR